MPKTLRQCWFEKIKTGWPKNGRHSQLCLENQLISTYQQLITTYLISIHILLYWEPTYIHILSLSSCLLIILFCLHFFCPFVMQLSFHRKEDPPSHDNRTVAPYVSYPAIVSDNHAKNTKEKTPSESWRKKRDIWMLFINQSWEKERRKQAEKGEVDDLEREGCCFVFSWVIWWRHDTRDRLMEIKIEESVTKLRWDSGKENRNRGRGQCT